MFYGFTLNFMSPVKSLNKKTYGKGNDNVKMIKFTLWKTISVLTIVCSPLYRVYLKSQFV